MANVYVSDCHWAHKNVIKFCNRPTTAEEQNEWIIKQVNSKIAPGDDVWFLGDFSFDKKHDFLVDILSKLKGNWHIVPGNHDQTKHKKTPEQLINAVADSNRLHDTKHEVLPMYYVERFPILGKTVMCHFPIEHWDSARHGTVHLHGHLHGSPCRNLFNRFDIGLDGHPDFLPYTEQELFDAIQVKNAKDDVIIHSHH